MAVKPRHCRRDPGQGQDRLGLRAAQLQTQRCAQTQACYGTGCLGAGRSGTSCWDAGVLRGVCGDPRHSPVHQPWLTGCHSPSPAQAQHNPLQLCWAPHSASDPLRKGKAHWEHKITHGRKSPGQSLLHNQEMTCEPVLSAHLSSPRNC